MDVKAIIKNQDTSAFSDLNDDDFDSALIELVYNHLYERKLDSLNYVQQVIYLCSKIEDYCQADSILEILEEPQVFHALPQIPQAFEEIGAEKTADLMREFAEIMSSLSDIESDEIPDLDMIVENWEIEEKISEIDDKIADYPDGNMRALFRAYLESNENYGKTFDSLS